MTDKIEKVHWVAICKACDHYLGQAIMVVVEADHGRRPTVDCIVHGFNVEAITIGNPFGVEEW